MSWKQVTQDEYKVLKRFVPSKKESVTHYYVDGTTLTSKKANGSNGHVETSEGKPSLRGKHKKTGRMENKIIRMSSKTSRVAKHEGTLTEKVYRTVSKVLEGVKNGELGRIELVKRVISDTSLGRNQVQAFITELLRRKYLVAQKFITTDSPGFPGF